MFDPDDVSILPYVLLAITFWTVMGITPFVRLRRSSSVHQDITREFRQKTRG